MNKSELISSIESKVVCLIGDPVLKLSSGRVNFYEQSILALEGLDRAADRTVVFYVVDEGLPAEVAYFRETTHRQTEYREKATKYMINLVSNGTISGFEIEQIQADLGSKSFFIVTVYVDDGSGKLIEKRFHVSRNDSNQIVRKEIVLSGGGVA